jgi:class 3 adenylate cyclase
MSIESALSKLTRYEALFELSNELNVSGNIVNAGKIMASRLKYVADVFSWRYFSVPGEGKGALSHERNVLIIDGYRGQATVANNLNQALTPVESKWWEDGNTCLIEGEALIAAKKSLPELFHKNDIIQIYVYPEFEDRKLQGMFIFSKRKQPFNEVDIKFISFASHFFHRKVHQIRTEERIAKVIRQRNEYLAALHETTLGLIRRLDLNELLEDLVARAGQLLGTPHGYIFLPEHENGDEVILENKVGVGVLGRVVGFRTKPGSGVAGVVWQSGRPLVVTNYDAWEHRAPNFPVNLIRAIVGVPLIQNKSSNDSSTPASSHPVTNLETGLTQEVVGVLGLAYDSKSEQAFGAEEVELLNRFADLATIAMDNARLYTEVQQAAEFIRRTFGRYISEEVVASLLDSEEGLELGGVKRKVTTLMSDLRGFTRFLERLTPEQVVAFLNRYLSMMVNVVLEYHGTIIEILGDGIMVIFGAPIQRDDDALRACACAIAMQLAMEDVNQQNLRDGLPEVEMGIGIHTGEVIVGNIGSEKRTKYGAVGGDVNLAGRIESYTTGGQILISNSTHVETADLLKITQTMTVEPKGVSEPITIYEVEGIGGDYNLDLPRHREALAPLKKKIPVRYTVLEKKFVTRTTYQGCFISLSTKEAELMTENPVAILSNLKIQLIQNEGEVEIDNFFAKVLATTEDPQRYLIRFTSIPPKGLAIFQDRPNI